MLGTNPAQKSPPAAIVHQDQSYRVSIAQYHVRNLSTPPSLDGRIPGVLASPSTPVRGSARGQLVVTKICAFPVIVC